MDSKLRIEVIRNANWGEGHHRVNEALREVIYRGEGYHNMPNQSAIKIEVT
ncbi:hypothetical protein [Ureibacillus sinduriensis]|uniref:hypothetical protein n=1 Tax=Ureibacillus sinduriensis TaxID=561440 RepID=UPI000AF0E9B1|nr:hypothetical protein [Ureibacillus sinduriensis]